MASRLGTSGRRISDIETGKRIPRDDEIGAAQVFGAGKAGGGHHAVALM